MLATVPKPAKPAKPPTNAKAAPPDRGHVQTAFRLPNELLEGLDALVERANEHRPWPKLTRSELVRLVLTHAVEEPPAWLVGGVVGPRVSAEEAYPGLGAMMQGEQGKKTGK